MFSNIVSDSLNQLIQGQNLAKKQVEDCFDALADAPNDAQLAALVALLEAKGMTEAECSGLLQSLSKRMVTLQPQRSVVDIVGTGGDGLDTVNISTGGALLAAACGVPIVKHGNRAVTSACGAADLLEQAGVQLDALTSRVQNSAANRPFTFCYAPLFHPALGSFKPVRRQLGLRTVLHLIGPLLNPAQADYRIIGVASSRCMALVAKGVKALGVKRALIVHCQGSDELCTLGPMDILEVCGKEERAYQVNPETLGFHRCHPGELVGGDQAVNYQCLTQALSGQSSAISDALILNAAGALYLYGLASSFEEGVGIATEHQRQGAGLAILKQYAAFTQQRTV